MRWMAGMLAISVLIGACASGNSERYERVGPDELAAMLEDKDFVLVNTHVPYQGELPKTDLFIPFDEIGSHLDGLPGKAAKIVVYCRSGPMSTTAARELVSLGYTNVYELYGGMNAWETAGYELIER